MSESFRDQEANRTIAEQGVTDLLAEYDRPADAFETAGSVSVDTMLEALAHPGRRYVLTYLLLRDEFVSLSELVDFVVSVTESPGARTTFRDQIVRELAGNHLPKLAEKGLVEYRIERQFIGPTDRTRAALPYLHLALKHASSEAESEAEGRNP
jgi:hypothetical protein